MESSGAKRAHRVAGGSYGLAAAGHVVRLARGRWATSDRIDPFALPELLTALRRRVLAGDGPPDLDIPAPSARRWKMSR